MEGCPPMRKTKPLASTVDPGVFDPSLTTLRMKVVSGVGVGGANWPPWQLLGRNIVSREVKQGYLKGDVAYEYMLSE